jgi:hypothetical protein
LGYRMEEVRVMGRFDGGESGVTGISSRRQVAGDHMAAWREGRETPK